MNHFQTKLENDKETVLQTEDGIKNWLPVNALRYLRQWLQRGIPCLKEYMTTVRFFVNMAIWHRNTARKPGF